MFDPTVYREACREITAPEDKIEEIIAMTEKTTKKKLRPLRAALIAAAAVSMMVVGVAAANPEGFLDFVGSIASYVQVDRYRSNVITKDGQTFERLSMPIARLENRDGRAILVVNEEDAADITDALAQDQHYVFEDYSGDTRVTVTVDGTINQWNIEAKIGVIREDDTYEEFGSVIVTSEDEENLCSVFFDKELDGSEAE